MKPIETLSSMFLLAATLPAIAGSEPWRDTFYQYRIPITFTVDQAGWHVLPLDETRITGAINQLEELKYSHRSFAYNYLECVAVDETGQAAKPVAEAGFYLIETGPDLARGWDRHVVPTNAAAPMFEENGIAPPVRKGDEIAVPVERGAYYLLRYATGGASSPAYKYEPIFPEGTKLCKYAYGISYEPRLLPLTMTEYETLLQPNDECMKLVVGGRFVNTPRKLEVRRAQVVLLANVSRAGLHRWALYYQPMGAHFLMVPERRHAEVPSAVARLDDVGPAEKYEGRTHCLLGETPRVALWFADTTVKLTPETPPPTRSEPAIRIACARNERQSFQVVLTPRRAQRFGGVKVSDLRNGNATIPTERLSVRAIGYVPIRKTSTITPASLRGWVGDPLVPAVPRLLTPEEGNLGLWVTVDVKTNDLPGAYTGNLRIMAADETALFEVPIELTVHRFALPEFSPLQCNLGGHFLAKPSGPAREGQPPPRGMDTHGVTRREDLQKLARAYYEVMVRNKFTPANVALYTPIGLKWDPPPEGLNVDKPDNFFRLYDWDFTAFNAQMDYFVNTLKLNQICIYHSNPISLNIFMHLPGKELDGYAASTPFVTYAWQTFRETTFVGYDIDEKHSYRKLAQDITRDQYDRLVLDFFRAIAGNLDEHGWLRHAIIMIDESHNDKQLKHFLRLMKSDPLTARIPIGVCIQGLTYFLDQEYNGLLDYYMPEMGENYNRWEPFYFSDYGIAHDRRKLWNYIVGGSRFAIDAPGVNNRVVGLDLWKRGCGGYLCWDTFLYGHAYGDNDGEWGHSRNPWLDPYTRMGNGVLSFFYPPRRDGTRPEQPDFAITPSLRVEIHREAVDDYEYAWLLNKLAGEAEQAGRDASAARAVLAEIPRFFHNANLWSQNDAWLLELRTRLAEAIDNMSNP